MYIGSQRGKLCHGQAMELQELPNACGLGIMNSGRKEACRMKGVMNQ